MRRDFLVISSLPRADTVALGLLSVLWLLPIFVIGIHGDFPLNDDWAYAQATLHFLETGQYERSAWTYTPVLTNIGIGAVASYLAGFSFETLRATGVFFGWIGVLSSYALGRVTGVAVAPSVILAAVIALNPVYLNLSYTFMTDVPFAAMMFASLALFTRGLSTDSLYTILGGIVLTFAGILSRQPGVAVLAAFALAISLRFFYRGDRRTRVVVTLITTAIFVLITYLILNDIFGLSYIFYSLFHHFNSPYVFYHVLRNGLTVFVYLGLFLAPISFFAVDWSSLPGRCLAVGSALLAIVGLVILERYELRMPLGINIVQDYGLGPQRLYGADDSPLGGSAFLWAALTTLGFWSACVAVGVMLSGLWRERARLLVRPELVLVVVFVAAYLLPFLPRSPLFDRYLLPVIAPIGALILVLAPGRERSASGRRIIPVAIIVLLAAWSVTGTRDYLVHQRARHELLTPLLLQGVETDRIDGGFEFTGWFNSKSAPELRRANSERRWLSDDEYVLTYKPVVPGYDRVSTVQYQRWFTGRLETLSLHGRED